MQKRIILLVFFLLFWFVDLAMIYMNERTYLVFPRVLSLLCLGLYYIFSVTKVKAKFYVLWFLVLLTGGLFSLNDYTLLGMLSLIALRLSWIRLLFSYKERMDKKLVLLIFVFAGVVISIILYMMFVNTLFFYLSILTSVALLILLSISFTKLLTGGLSKGNKEMFMSVAIFIFSDALSGSKKIEGTTSTFVALSVLLYNIAYYFMIVSLIKKERSISKIN